MSLIHFAKDSTIKISTLHEKSYFLKFEDEDFARSLMFELQKSVALHMKPPQAPFDSNTPSPVSTRRHRSNSSDLESNNHRDLFREVSTSSSIISSPHQKSPTHSSNFRHMIIPDDLLPSNDDDIFCLDDPIYLKTETQLCSHQQNVDLEDFLLDSLSTVSSEASIIAHQVQHPPDSLSLDCYGKSIVCCSATNAGNKQHNEDTFLLAHNVFLGLDLIVAAICDGHDGTTASFRFRDFFCSYLIAEMSAAAVDSIDYDGEWLMACVSQSIIKFDADFIVRLLN